MPALLMGLHGVAGSATATNTLLVTATVSAACVVTTLPVAFGVYNPTLGTVLDGTGTVSVTCTNGTAYTVGLDGGSQADVAARAMVNGADLLSYQLYSDALRASAWGDTVGQLVSATGTGLPVSHTVYGRVAASQNVPAGSYSDTVNVTVTYN
ncbi:MAG: spore coat U domain-containing protein [Burkholderiaceae bacterium]